MSNALTIEEAEAQLGPETKRELFGWKMFDWGWSAFSTTVVTALLGPYLQELAGDDGVDILGFNIDDGSLFPYFVSFSALLQVFALPLIGSVTDYTGIRKRLMMTLAGIGSVATALLFVVVESTILLGGLLFTVAVVAFSSASVIYNSYLPDLVPPVLRDRVSSAGFAYGYLGGALWLAINFALVAVMDDTELAVRLSLGGTGVWALVFIFGFTGRMLGERPANRTKPDDVGWLKLGIQSNLNTLREMRGSYPITFRYLIAYLIFNDGIATVITVAAVYASDVLDTSAETLLLLVLMIQFVAVPGALIFGRLAETVGAKNALMFNLSIWVVLVLYAWGFLANDTQLFVMGAFLALVLGGSQALSRSLYSQMIPLEREAEYFGFYEIAARGTSWLGPLVFGLANQVFGSQRPALLVLLVFFALGLVLLAPVRVRAAMTAVGQDPGTMVV